MYSVIQIRSVLSCETKFKTFFSACEEPYFGINCLQKCSDCFNQSCHQVTGKCNVEVKISEKFIDFVPWKISICNTNFENVGRIHENYPFYKCYTLEKNVHFITLFSALERNRHWWCKNGIFRRGKSCCYCYRCHHCRWFNYLQAVWFIFHIIVCTCNIHHVLFLKEFLYHSVIFGIRIAFPLHTVYVYP